MQDIMILSGGSILGFFPKYIVGQTSVSHSLLGHKASMYTYENIDRYRNVVLEIMKEEQEKKKNG